MSKFTLHMGGMTIGTRLLGFQEKGQDIKAGLFRLADGFVGNNGKGAIDGTLSVVSVREKRAALGNARKSFLKGYFQEIIGSSTGNNLKKEADSFLGSFSRYAHDERFVSLLDKVRHGVPGRAILFDDATIFFYFFKAKEGFLFFDRDGRGPGRALDMLFDTLRCVSLAYFLDSEGIILHGAGAAVKGKGYVFLGKADAGKTTLSSFLPRGSVFSDEAIIIRKKQGGYFLFSTPFGDFSNKSPEKEVKVCKIFSLAQDNKTFVEDISQARLMTELINDYLFISPFFGRYFMRKAIRFFYDFLLATPSHRLHFKKDREFLKLLV